MHHRPVNLRLLGELGFRVASSLPVRREDGQSQLRPVEEILARALALRTVCLWVATDESVVPSAMILEGIRSHALNDYFSETEREILRLSRKHAQEEHVGTVGWRLENIWPLAWLLGFEPKPDLSGMFDDSRIPDLLSYFPKVDESRASFLAARRPKSVTEVDGLEDLFYCAHNAVRSAQLGHDTVPKDFDVRTDGRAVYERRHALTWALSPGVAWDEVDLST